MVWFCKHCDGAMPPPKKKGRHRMFCDAVCRGRYYMAASYVERDCTVCGKPFLGTPKQQQCGAISCAKAHRSAVTKRSHDRLRLERLAADRARRLRRRAAINALKEMGLLDAL